MKKRILITGANRGIGLEITRQLAEQGHKVFLGSRNHSKGEEAAQSFVEKGLDIRVIQLDVGSEDSIRHAFDEYQKENDRLDVLINNAGIFTDRNYSLEDIPMEIFDEIINVNFRGALLMTRIFLPLLKTSSDARIVNLSSGLGAFNEMGGGYPGYRISKTAMNAMTAIFGSELSNYGIKSNSMCPGWVKTDMGGSGAMRDLPHGAETAVWLATAQQIPNGKFLRDKKVIDW